MTSVGNPPSRPSSPSSHLQEIEINPEQTDPAAGKKTFTESSPKSSKVAKHQLPNFLKSLKERIFGTSKERIFGTSSEKLTKNEKYVQKLTANYRTSSTSALKLAEIYENGTHGQEKDLKKAYSIYSTITIAMSPKEKKTYIAEVYLKLANMHWKGIGTEKNQNQAIQCLKDSADAGHPKAAYDLSQAFLTKDREEGTPISAQDKEASHIALQKAAALKHPKALLEFGILKMSQNPPTKNSYIEAKFYLKASSKQGNTEAKGHLEDLRERSNQFPTYQKIQTKCEKENLKYEAKLQRYEEKLKRYEANRVARSPNDADSQSEVNSQSEPSQSEDIVQSEPHSQNKDFYNPNPKMPKVPKSWFNATWRMARAHEVGFGLPEKNPTAALSFYEKIAQKQGNNPLIPEANFKMGQILTSGNVKKDVPEHDRQKEAFQHFKVAADAGRIDALFIQSHMLKEGIGVEKNPEESLNILAKLAEKGVAKAQFDYGMICKENGQFLKAATLLSRASKQNYPEAKSALKEVKNTIKELNLNEKLYNKALNSSHKEFVQNEKILEKYPNGHKTLRLNFEKQIQLAQMHEHGIATKQDNQEAYKIYLDMATAKYAPPYAQFKVGEMCRKGIGTEKNKVRAKAFYRMASVEGHTKSKVALALLLKDPEEAEERRTFLEEASAQGNPDAQCNLAYTYLEDDNVSQAIALLKKAGKQNHAEALFSLGVFYNTPHYEDHQDFAKSKKFLLKAKSLGYENLTGGKQEINNALDSLEENIKNEKNIKHKLRKSDTHGKIYHVKSLRRAKSYAEAKQVCAFLLKNGTPEAFNQLGEMAKNGEGEHNDQPNLKAARRFFQLGYDRNHQEARAQYAQMLQKGEGGEQDLKTAFILANGNFIQDKTGISSLVVGEMIVDNDPNISETFKAPKESQRMKTATQFFETSMEKGNLEGTIRYAEQIGKNKSPETQKKAFEIAFEIAFETQEKDTSGRINNVLGEILKANDIKEAINEKFDTTVNRSGLAFDYFESGMQQGNIDATINYAMMLGKGEGLQNRQGEFQGKNLPDLALNLAFSLKDKLQTQAQSGCLDNAIAEIIKNAQASTIKKYIPNYDGNKDAVVEHFYREGAKKDNPDARTALNALEEEAPPPPPPFNGGQIPELDEQPAPVPNPAPPEQDGNDSDNT